MRRIRTGQAAGVILFARNFRNNRELARLTRRLQAIPQPPAVRAPLLILIDQEGGLVKRVAGPPDRSAAAMGRGDPALARSEGQATARLLRGLGVNVDLAPVADVARKASALAREQRTFGGNAGTVAALSGAFASGLNDGRVAATFKHFPGLGMASDDSDRRQVEIGLPKVVLRTVDESPFRAASAGGPRLVMLSLAVYPQLSPQPAALSRDVAEGELRGSLGFRGVSITDSLDTPATERYGSHAELALRALDAGVDLVLFGRSYRGAASAADAALAGLRQGRLDHSQLLDGSRRVIALRRQLAR